MEFRNKFSLRPLIALETGKSIGETAPGTYFFTLDRWIDIKRDNFESEIMRFDVRNHSKQYDLEIHHTSNGGFYIVGFVSNTHAAETSELTGAERKNITLSSSWQPEFPMLVRLPVSRILVSSYREIDLSDQKQIGVIDFELQ